MAVKGKANGKPIEGRQVAPKSKKKTEVSEETGNGKDNSIANTSVENIKNWSDARKRKNKKDTEAVAVTETPKPDVRKVSHTKEGQGYIPGAEPVVDATLERLANKMEESRDLMMQARKQYTIDEEALRAYMEDNNISKQQLTNNRVVFLEDKIKARVRKDKGEDTDEDI